VRIITGICCLLLLAACSDKPGNTALPEKSASASAAAAPSPTDRLCSDPDLNDKQVAFAGQGGAFLAGYLLGDRDSAVTLVLAPQASATGCSWLAWAKLKAAAGYRVLAFDFNGEGRSRRADPATGSGDVLAAAAFARAKGGRGVVLVGASRGGTAVLVAAAGLEPPATAVISLSAPARYAGEDALPAAPRFAMPALYVAATSDRSFATDAQQMHDATPTDRRTLALVPGDLHGTSLLTITGPGNPEATRAVDDFLAKHAPTGR
jgi:pimeloyl-ACP methyl ester carboxylesterase